MPTIPRLNDSQRYWPEAEARGVKVRETFVDGHGWLTDFELSELTGLKLRTVQRRLTRGSDLLAPLGRGNWGEYYF